VYKLFCYVVYFSGLAWLIRNLLGRNKVTIVLYHSPDKNVFEEHIKHLQQHYIFIELDTLIQAIQNGKSDFPKNSLIITFDDGHQNNFELLEIFKSLKARPTIYLCSAIVATHRRFWFRLPGLRSKHLKKLDHASRLKQLQTDFNFFPEQEYVGESREALSAEEIKTMLPCTDFQSHTCLHPILTTCSNDVAESEIRESRLQLERLTNSTVKHFAYPNGDYSEREIAYLKASGYTSGRTTDIGWNDHTSDPFRLKITGVSDRADIIMLKAELSGVPGYFYNLFTAGIHLKAFSGKHVPESEKV
jgi:peptidoglycan/xylan/chitin deacetylase (PgdA/CDA1 family)